MQSGLVHCQYCKILKPSLSQVESTWNSNSSCDRLNYVRKLFVIKLFFLFKCCALVISVSSVSCLFLFINLVLYLRMADVDTHLQNFQRIEISLEHNFASFEYRFSILFVEQVFKLAYIFILNPLYALISVVILSKILTEFIDQATILKNNLCHGEEVSSEKHLGQIVIIIFVLLHNHALIFFLGIFSLWFSHNFQSFFHLFNFLVFVVKFVESFNCNFRLVVVEHFFFFNVL